MPRTARLVLAGLALAALAVWGLRDILLPFAAGLALAYLLDPVVDRLEAFRLPRWLGTLIVLVSAMLLAIGMMLLLVPVVLTQMERLAAILPGEIDQLRAAATERIGALQDHLGPERTAELKAAVSRSAGMALDWTGWLIGQIVSRGVALFDILSLVVITPVVAFYLLRDWDIMIARIDEQLPPRHRERVETLSRAVNATLSGFVRGQSMVCAALALFYAIGLSIAGLQFGLIIGLIAGALSFVPFVGSMVGLVLSVGLAALQFESWSMTAVVLGIFLAGQAIEGNVLTPRFVGDNVGLHPVWVIFALMAGGSLMGFLGVLIAVPAAAVIGVFVRSGLAAWRSSDLFTGGSPPPAPNA